jgi:hypothetical protein
MINFYGGIWNLEYNPVVLRVLSWRVRTFQTQITTANKFQRSDIAYSTRFGTSLEYPCLTSQLDVYFDMLPLDLPLFPLDDLAAQLLQTLRQISHIISLPNMTPYQKHSTASTVTNTEYLILSNTIPFTAYISPLSILSQAFTLASLLYLHLTFRLLPSFPNSSKLHHRLISTILSLLSSLSLNQFTSPESQDLLLWVVFVCSAASGSGFLQSQQRKTGVELKEGIRVNARDFVVLMRNVDPGIVRQSKGEVRARLRRVVWKEGVCDTLHDGIWRVVEEMRGGGI